MSEKTDLVLYRYNPVSVTPDILIGVPCEPVALAQYWHEGWRWAGAVYEALSWGTACQFVIESYDLNQDVATIKVYGTITKSPIHVDLSTLTGITTRLFGAYKKTIAADENSGCAHDWIDSGMIRQYCRKCPAIGDNKNGFITVSQRNVA